MTWPMTVKLAVEEDGRDPRKYKRIHAAGCRALRDPMPVTFVDFDGLSYDAVGFGIIDEESDSEGLRAMLAPCAVDAINQQVGGQ